MGAVSTALKGHWAMACGYHRSQANRDGPMKFHSPQISLAHSHWQAIAWLF